MRTWSSKYRQYSIYGLWRYIKEYKSTSKELINGGLIDRVRNLEENIDYLKCSKSADAFLRLGFILRDSKNFISRIT